MRHVVATEVEAHWGFVEHGLKVILRRCGEGNWKPEDVKARLLDGRAGLFVCDDGFIVLEIDTEPVSDRVFLNAWLAWFKPGYAKKHREELVGWMDEMQRKAGCEWWQFSSPRQGWVGIEPDCEIHMITWRRKR